MPREDSQLLLEDMKVFIIVKSHLLACSVCALIRPHKMRYKLLECSSKTCKASTPYDGCPWEGKVLTCQELNRVTIMETGSHETLVREPHNAKLTARLKNHGRELATQGMKPAQIHRSMGRQYGLSEDAMPTLRQVQLKQGEQRFVPGIHLVRATLICVTLLQQWFVANFSKRNLHRIDDHDEILSQIEELSYHPGIADTQPFSFAWERDTNGRPDVGHGSDERPFLVGLTTKRLLLNAARDPTSFVFHMDATFKLNQVSYPVIVCGISDRCRSFHLVAQFITFQRLESLYVKALKALRKMFTAVTKHHMLLKYVMADAETAQQNAVEEVFGVDSEFIYLMCFYHATTKVHEKLKGVTNPLHEQVVADIYDLHFASNQDVYDEQVAVVLDKWKRHESLTGFQAYFDSVWVTSEFGRWQCFHTPGGYATTNNPVEQFNRLIKRDYTLRTKHKIGALIGLLADCCDHQSVTPRTFKEVSDASQPLKARVKDFCQRGLLVDMTPAVLASSSSSFHRTPVLFVCYLAVATACICLSWGVVAKLHPFRPRWVLNTPAWSLKDNPRGDGVSMWIRVRVGASTTSRFRSVSMFCLLSKSRTTLG